MQQTLPFCKTLFAFLLLFTLKATAQPTISSFTPSSGPVGTSVIITGTNFNSVPANNIVFFGGVKATVTAATTTSLTVTVPAGATYQPISVLNNSTGLTGYSSKPFITTFNNLASGIPANFYRPKVDFVTGTNPRNVAAGDLDGDNKPEIVVTNGNSDNMSVLRNVSTAGNISASSFAAKVDFPTGTFLEFVAIGDVDGDGKPDLVFIQSGSIAVMRNTSTAGSISAASFAAKVNFTQAFSGASSVAIGDVDGDGKPELVSANRTANTISIVRNTSTPGSLSFAPKVDFATGGTPSSVATGDVDGDGKTDVVTANAGASSNSVSVLRNTSTSGIINASSFAAKADFTTGATPGSVAIGDVDGDGKPDLVVANSAATSTTLSVLRNTSTSGAINASSFTAKVDFTTGLSPRFVAIGDVNGDGKPDLVTANVNSNTISVLRNTSTSGTISASSFAAKVDFPTGNGPVSVAIGDLNGDSIPELAAANGAAGSVSVLQADNLVLPVTLTNIKAFQKNQGIQVEWTTQQESNIDRYEVERSENGQQFTTIGNVPAKGSSIATNYNLFDPNPSIINFYRIKIFDKLGYYTYEQVIRININAEFKNTMNLYPNPITNNTVALAMNLQKGRYLITLTNQLGQQILTKVLNHSGGSATENIEPSKALAAGVYQLRLSGEGININRQVIKK